MLSLEHKPTPLAGDEAPLQHSSGSGSLPASVARRGQRLLHAQCWAWGQDVRHAERNLLLEYGSERQRPPCAVSGSSQYSLSLGPDVRLRLWGFGVYVGRGTGMYLNRFEFVPRRVRLQDTWGPDPFAGAPRYVDLEYLSIFLSWAASYEVWVEKKLGPEYRRRTFCKWKSRLNPELAREWQSLRDKIAWSPHVVPQC